MPIFNRVHAVHKQLTEFGAEERTGLPEAAVEAGILRGFIVSFPFMYCFYLALWSCAYLANTPSGAAFRDMSRKISDASGRLTDAVSTLPPFCNAKVLTSQRTMLQCERKAISPLP